jgi:hypothetical protein
MPPLWQINLAVILAAVLWLTTNMLVFLNGMENWARLAVHIALALYMGGKIAAAIRWVLDQIDPQVRCASADDA